MTAVCEYTAYNTAGKTMTGRFSLLVTITVWIILLQGSKASSEGNRSATIYESYRKLIQANEALVERMKTFLKTSGIDGSGCGSGSAAASGATFVHWGRATCPNTTSLIYSGYTGGSYYSAKSGPATILCLPKQPQYVAYSLAFQHQATIHGTEYNDRNTFPDFKKVQHQNVPCAVCQMKSEAQVLMIPARNECYPGWKMTYWGYLMAGDYNRASSEYICVDKDPGTTEGGHRQTFGQLLYIVESRCDTLPCPPYKQNGELTCVVCAK
ncbi:uncharacterized protein [Haliotis cracherodii]|uniref:uncharacterized protein n=1 Tax=Haliotis cracherodii TaxID=6455 RepID=UPI0039E7F1A1